MTDKRDCLLKGDFVLSCDYETEIMAFTGHLSGLLHRQRTLKGERLKACDQYGSTIYADPIRVNFEKVDPPLVEQTYQLQGIQNRQCEVTYFFSPS